MRLFIDTSGGCLPYWRSGQKGRELLDWLALYSEGYFVTFEDEILDGGEFGPGKGGKDNPDGKGGKDNPDGKIRFRSQGGPTNANCLGHDHLCEGDELKVMLSDGYFEPLKFVPRNMVIIDPVGHFDPKTLALHLSFLDDELRKMEAARFVVR